ncbi:MAG: formylglycine-generating enzyme family protein [Sedimentisphaerales bacterium]|nr:formylglycine-generating enzyme family protein [Sedimentisphaerales bacterium]
MDNHPIVDVSWYGAKAFCDYYGYRLPTEWEWQAVADYHGSYTYGCGTTIDSSKANYDSNNPINLSDYPYTTPVDYYPFYGYGMNDISGNAWEWTSSIKSDGKYVLRGGSFLSSDNYCQVSMKVFNTPTTCNFDKGFRVCR